MRLPLASDKACYNHINIPQEPATLVNIIQRIPSRCLLLQVEHLWVVVGITDKVSITFS